MIPKSWKSKKLLILSISFSFTLMALLLLTPERAASQPVVVDGWIDFGSSSSTATASMKVIQAGATEIDLAARIPGVRAETRIVEGKDITQLSGDDFGKGSIYGYPDLPVLRREVEIPYDATYSLELLNVYTTKTSLQELGFPGTIYPLQPPDCKCDDQPPVFAQDQAIYTQERYYPDQPIAITGEYIERGHRILTVEVWPIAYNPVSGNLLFYSSIDFRIQLAGSNLAKTQGQAERYASPAYESRLAAQVLNYNQGKPTRSFTSSDPVGYLIVSADAYADHMVPFVALKQAEGFTVTLTPLSEIGSTTTAIKTYIQDAYNNWAVPPSYVLLVGDTDTLPTWTGLVIYTSTDLYYATMDGFTDWHPDLGRGRFPVRSTAQVDAMVNKYLAYASLDGTEAWLKKAAFPATCDLYQVAEGSHNYVIDSYMIDHGFTGLFPNSPQPGGDQLYCFTYGAEQADVQASMNDGRGMLIYSGHGSYTGWELYTQSAIPTITAGHYPFVASHACQTGDYGQPEVFGETWVLQDNKGALAFWGSAAYSYWDQDDVLERAMFDSLFAEGEPEPDYTGMTYDGLAAVETTYPSSAHYYWETYNILGDPAASIVLEPRSADLELWAEPAAVSICGSGSVTTTVTAGSIRGKSLALDLGVLNLPVGIDAAYDPAALILPGDSILNITVTESAEVGVYPLELQGIIPNEVTKTTTVTLGVYLDSPGTPELPFPAPEATNVPILPAFQWSASQGQTYDIQIATDPAFTQLVSHAEGLTQAGYVPTGSLSYATGYYWKVVAHNPCGDSSSSPVWHFLTGPESGLCSTGTREVSLLSEDFEGAPVGWGHGGLNDTWASSSIRKHSGVSAYKAADQPQVSDQWLASPSIDLAGPGPFALSFWNYQYLQNRPEGCYDGGIIEVSTDGGVTWVQLKDQLISDPYNGPIAVGTSNPLIGQPAWCGKPQNWVDSQIDLDEYAGQTIQVRFRLGTDNAIMYEGWYVDDVTVKTCEAGADFESSSSQSVEAGSIVTHTFQLGNQGPSDNYQLSLSGNLWPSEILGILQITVTQGTTATIQVRVATPARETGTDSFTLIAVSLNTPGISITATGTTSTWMPEIAFLKMYLPMVGK